jgi:hypothetical protein
MRGATIRRVTLVAALALAACDGSSPTPAPTPSPTPTPTSSPVNYVVEPCFTQAVPGTAGQSLRDMIIPDTLRLDLSRPSGFPNGRDLDDPVVDILLAMLFLDFGVTGQSTLTFANLPLNPPGNDRPFTSTFPFLAPPQGTPPIAATTGTVFDFRTDPDAAYVQVDRMGQPAIATALIGSPLKNPYNDVGPPADTAGTFVADQTAQLTNLMLAIGDDLDRIGLEICADT